MLCVSLRPVWITLAPTQSPRASLFRPPTSTMPIRLPYGVLPCSAAGRRRGTVAQIYPVVCPIIYPITEVLDRFSVPSGQMSN